MSSYPRNLFRENPLDPGSLQLNAEKDVEEASDLEWRGSVENILMSGTASNPIVPFNPSSKLICCPQPTRAAGPGFLRHTSIMRTWKLCLISYVSFCVWSRLVRLVSWPWKSDLDDDSLFFFTNGMLSKFMFFAGGLALFLAPRRGQFAWQIDVSDSSSIPLRHPHSD